MRSAARNTFNGAPSAVVGTNSLILQGVAIAAMSANLLWLVWIYGNALHDRRYLDGWILAGGMALQLGFHIALKTARLSPKSAVRWRTAHIFTGYLLIAAFISHSDFSLPDTGFEWALWSCFVIVMLSGLFGTYLAWSLKAKRGIEDSAGLDRLSARRTELARDVQAVVARSDRSAHAIGLPEVPYDAWITDLYTNHLRDFFQKPRHVTAHLIGSQCPLKRLTNEIDGLSRYVDQHNQEKLAAIKSLVIEKDQLDFARVYLALTKGWLFVHVPVTYALFVLTVLHIVVVYAFSSGTW